LACASERRTNEANITVDGASRHNDACLDCRAGENLALSGLPPALVSVRYAEIPRLPNGKPDLPALLAPFEVDRKPVGDLVDTLRRAYGQALGYDHVAEAASFVQLGGDSLSFVELSVRLEELLGHLPTHGPR
jgi:hypothetical protein